MERRTFWGEVLPILLALGVIAYEAGTLLNSSEGVAADPNTAVLFFLRTFFVFVIMPMVLILDFFALWGFHHFKAGSRAWQVRFFAKTLYLILFLIAAGEAARYLL